MTKIFIVGLALTAALMAPASAQNSMWGGKGALPASYGPSCQTMISRALSRQTDNPVRAAQAQRELSLAQSNMQAGNELACKLHAQAALAALR